METEWQALPNLASVCAVQADGWDIESRTLAVPEWKPWDGHVWKSFMDFRGRPKQPKTKTIKLEGWLDFRSELHLVVAGHESGFTKWLRVPSEDKTVEVEVEA